MFNPALFTPRNVLVIAVFAVAWQLIMSRVNKYLETRETASA